MLLLFATNITPSTNGVLENVDRNLIGDDIKAEPLAVYDS